MKVKDMKKVLNKRPYKLHPLTLKVLLGIKRSLKLVAHWLQQKTNGYSGTKIKIILILCCGLFFSECVIIVYQSFRNNNKVSANIIPIRPVIILKKQEINPIMTGKEFNHIHKLKLYLDSIKAVNETQFDSLVFSRPHLLDTINYLENLYYEQQPNRK